MSQVNCDLTRVESGRVKSNELTDPVELDQIINYRCFQNYANLKIKNNCKQKQFRF